ncbi:MAG TPA: MGMT family protein [Nevskiaceae bacterium]|nr:MGMT family protein [Nevskiaceae bacterium]
MLHATYERIWAVVRRIPKGRVATYGQIATMAGFAKQPRLAGYAMHNIPDGEALAWHRVINAQGRISFPKGGAKYREQKRRLEAEGVVFLKGRVDLARWRWQARADAPVLD